MRRISTAVLTMASLLSRGVDARAHETSWPLLGRTADVQFFSPLEGINKSNIARLRLKWYADVPTTAGLLGNPLVTGGVVYESGAGGEIWAHDLSTGRMLWSYTPTVKFNGSAEMGIGATSNRGLALWGQYVYVGTPDCRLIAVNRKTGKLTWEVSACDPGASLTISGAPRVGGGKVFIGNANMDLGRGRAHIDAFDARTGRRLWQFFTIPGDPAKGFENRAMAMAANTWGTEWWKKSAGGSVWDAITYDPKLNFLYFGTGGSQPMGLRDRGAMRGNKLFTDCIIAVDADTGRYVWHYQTTPDDVWDYDATAHIMVAELTIDGRPQRVVMTAPKNGFFYVLDARTGKLISAQNVVPVNWASRIDIDTGKPVERPGARFYERPGESVEIMPSLWGAHNWQAMSYSPETGLIYIPAMDLSMSMELSSSPRDPRGAVQLDWSRDLHDPARQGRIGRLIAWDPVVQQPRWMVNLPHAVNGGVLTTAGGLVFQGTGEGSLYAYDALTGRRLWANYTGSAIQAAPSTVEHHGGQIILVPVGIGGTLARMAPELLGTEGGGPDRLLAFSLTGNATLPPNPADARFTRPPRPRPADSARVERGRKLFAERDCAECHGRDAIRHPGGDRVPDLRRISAATLEEFAAIVVGGSRRDKGMPVFAGQISTDELEELEAFILSQAWDAYESQSAKARSIDEGER